MLIQARADCRETKNGEDASKNRKRRRVTHTTSNKPSKEEVTSSEAKATALNDARTAEDSALPGGTRICP